MAIQTIPGGMPLPVWPTNVGAAPSLSTSSFTIDAAGEKAALVAISAVAKSIRYIYVRTATVTTGDTVDVRIETVDTDGLPSGTLWAANTNVALAVAGSDDNVWLKAGPLTADAALSVGSVFAVVVVNGGGGGNIQIASYQDQLAQVPFGVHFTTSWTKRDFLPLFFIEYSDGTYAPIFGLLDIGAPINAQTFNSGSTTNRRGNRMTLPFPCQASGCWVWMGIGTATTFSVVLYDTDGSSVLATTGSVDSDIVEANTAGIAYIPFTAPVTLTSGGPYRLAFVPGSATNQTLYDFDVPEAAVMGSFPLGTDCYRSVFTSSAWVDTAASRSCLGLILTGFDDGAGGGGGGDGVSRNRWQRRM